MRLGIAGGVLAVLAVIAVILGYSSLEYQKIERGVSPLWDSARERILEAIHQAGRRRLDELLARRAAREREQTAWQQPPSVPGLIALLARREGGLIPLTRHLRRLGLKGLWTTRLRAIARGAEVPAWQVLEQIAGACGVSDLDDVRRFCFPNSPPIRQESLSLALVQGIKVKLCGGRAGPLLNDCVSCRRTPVGAAA